MASLLALPVELIVDIVAELGCHEVKQLCETCRWLKDICTPELYRAVDLSCHYADAKCQPLGFHLAYVPADFVWRRRIFADELVYQRQKRFISALENKPQLANLVYTLRWTVLDSGSDLNADCSHDEVDCCSDYELVEELRNSKYKWEEEDIVEEGPNSGMMWKTFQMMVNVLDLDLCWLSAWRDFTVPVPVFRKAKSIRFSGCTTPEFVGCILSSSMHSLERLEMHNVFQWPLMKPPLPSIDGWSKWKLYWKENKSKHETVNRSMYLVDALHPLTGSLVALTSLCIATVGHGNRCWPNSHDELRYSEWACFIDSLRSRLRYFGFKQGVSRNEGPESTCGTRRPPGGYHRPIDELFREWILPTLLQKRWPEICRMEIKGVDRHAITQFWDHIPTDAERALPGKLYGDVSPVRSSYSAGYSVQVTTIAFPSATQETLRKLLPENAELIVEEEAERDYEDYYHGTGSGIDFYDDDE